MQHLGLLTIVLLVAGLTLTALRWPGDLSITFSQRVATKRSSQIFYSMLFIVTLPIFTIFVASWLIPMKSLPVSFLWITLIAVVFQILCTFFPEEGGRKTTVHRVLTGISGVALLPLTLILATTSGPSGFARNSAWVALIMMTLLLTVALALQKGFRYALLLQIGYYAVFFGLILLVTYV